MWIRELSYYKQSEEKSTYRNFSLAVVIERQTVH